jgi:hypothetical protein
MKTFKLTPDVPKEYDEQKALAKYLDILGVLWTANMAGVKATPRIWMSMKAIGVKTGFPDVMIYEPRNGFVGLAIELKRIDWTKPTGDREKMQAIVLERLRKAGWCASFQAGSRQAIKEVDRYLRESDSN